MRRKQPVSLMAINASACETMATERKRCATDRQLVRRERAAPVRRLAVATMPTRDALRFGLRSHAAYSRSRSGNTLPTDLTKEVPQ